MKIIAAVFADFSETFLGTTSCLATPLGNCAIIDHTLRRVSEIEGVEGRWLVVRERDSAVAKSELAANPCATGFELHAIDSGARPRRKLFRSARKWNLNSWRGGPLGATYFDEYVEPAAVARVLQAAQADAVLCLDAYQPLLDAKIASAMVVHLRENIGEAKFVFSQAPPGLAGVLLHRDIVVELLQQEWPFGLLLAYRPEFPRADLITRSMCYRTPAVVSQCSGRFTADTRRSHQRLSLALDELGENCDAATLCRWWNRQAATVADPLPLEVEIELTTHDPLPNTTLRPRGDRVPARGPADPQSIAAVAREFSTWDDQLIVLGGHGDPLLHPDFPEICGTIRSAGVCGLAVTTPLVDLPDTTIEALLASEVDLIEVQLDANSAETYCSVHGTDAFDRVIANIERLEAARRTRRSPQPLIVPSLTRCDATANELEAFFDRWIVATGSAVIRGFSDFGGALAPPQSAGRAGVPLMTLAPLVRTACQRLQTRLVLLADGTAVACDQDFRGAASIGRWDRQSLADIWNGPGLNPLRESHSQAHWSNLVPCGRCGEWWRA